MIDSGQTSLNYPGQTGQPTLTANGGFGAGSNPPLGTVESSAQRPNLSQTRNYESFTGPNQTPGFSRVSVERQVNSLNPPNVSSSSDRWDNNMPNSSNSSVPVNTSSGNSTNAGFGRQVRPSVRRDSRSINVRPDIQAIGSVHNRSQDYSFHQAMSDHLDMYNRPPSRDSSVDRYRGSSRPPSRGPASRHTTPVPLTRNPRCPDRTPDSGLGLDDFFTSGRQTPQKFGAGSMSLRGSQQNIFPLNPLDSLPYHIPTSSDSLPSTPKRTESLKIPQPPQPKGGKKVSKRIFKIH